MTDKDLRDPDGLGFPEEGDTCMAPIRELPDDDAELCGAPATQRRLFCEMVMTYCDEHAAEMDEMDEGEKGNDEEFA